MRFGELDFVGQAAFDGVELRVGVQNVFDKEPPIIAEPNFQSGASFSTYGDPRLRRYSVQLRKSF